MLNENVFDEPDWASSTNGFSSYDHRSSVPSFDPFQTYEVGFTTFPFLFMQKNGGIFY